MREVIWEGGYEQDRKALPQTPEVAAAVEALEVCARDGTWEPKPVAVDFEGRMYFIRRRGASAGVPPLRLVYRLTDGYNYFLMIEFYDPVRGWCAGR